MEAPKATRAQVEAFVAIYMAHGATRSEAEVRARVATEDEPWA